MLGANQRTRFGLLLTLAAWSSSSCSTITNALNQTHDIAIRATPNSVTIQQGSSGTTQVELASTITNNAGFNDVNLTVTPNAGTPGGIHTTFAASTVNVPNGALRSTTLTIDVDNTVGGGTYTFTVKATYVEVTTETRTTTVTVIVPPTGSFALTTDPLSVTIPQGGSATASVIAAASSDFSPARQVVLGATPDAGITASLTATGLSPQAGGSASTTITVGAGATTPAGTYHVNIHGTATAAAAQDATLTVRVTAPGGAVTITQAAPTTGTVNQPYSYQFQASGGTGTYSWDAFGPLPPGLTLDPATGILSGTPTQSGVFTFDVEVSSGSQVDSKQVSLTVNP